MMECNQKMLRERTRQFALTIIAMYSSLPKSTIAQVLGRQVLRSGSSVGAQYREALRARSKAEFVSKIESVLQELDETDYWLELLESSMLFEHERAGQLRRETNELISVFTATVKTAKGLSGRRRSRITDQQSAISNQQ